MVEFEIGDTTIRANTSSDLFSPKGLDSGTKLLLEYIVRHPELASGSQNNPVIPDLDLESRKQKTKNKQIPDRAGDDTGVEHAEARPFMALRPGLISGNILDWGCGWGAMALWLGKNIPDAQVIGLDSDVGAVSIAKENVELNALSNVNIVASHGFSEIIDEQKFDLIVSNPPTHRGREVVEQMIAQSFERLHNNGNLIIVVEARLKPWVARQMKQVFGDYKIAKRGPKHVVLMATKVVQ